MTTTTAPIIETTDRGDHPFPAHCPSWCDREQHLAFALENDGVIDAVEMTAHYAGGGDDTLPEIRNYVTHDVQRDGGGHWSLTARQFLREPYAGMCGYASPELVELVVGDHTSGAHNQGVINMTTGEARVFATHILALCDRVDLPAVSR